MIARGQWQRLLLAAICLGAAGCRHKVARPVLPPLATAPVPLDKTPEASTPAQVPSVPLQPVPLPTVRAATKKAKKPKKKAVVAAAPALAPPAVAPSVPVSPTTTTTTTGAGTPSDSRAIGALSAGGDSRPETHQKAAELLASIDKRVSSLPSDTADKEKLQILRVRNFVHDAQVALHTGDADGALTLATKAKLLLDDLETK